MVNEQGASFYMSVPSRNLIVAVGDDHAKNARLLRFASRFARVSGMELSLVHVHQPAMALESTSTPYPLGLPARAERLFRRMEMSAVGAAEEKLRFLATEVAPDVPHTETVLVGEVTACLRELIDREKPAMLLVGAPATEDGAVAPLVSPAYALIDACAVPVMALPYDAEIDVPLSDLKVVVADDMRARGARVLTAAVDFVSRIGTGRIIGAHVHNMTGEMFAASFADVFATALGRPTAPGNAVLRLIRGIRPRLKRALTERAIKVGARRDGVHFQSMVLRGSVIPALREAARRIRADFVVFGRHRLWHKDGPKLGSVPAKAMLSFGRPVLIVPT